MLCDAATAAFRFAPHQGRRTRHIAQFSSRISEMSEHELISKHMWFGAKILGSKQKYLSFFHPPLFLPHVLCV